MNRQVKSQIRLGVSLLCWKIWNCHDYIVLEKVNVSNFVQVIHMATHFTSTWCFLLLDYTIIWRWLHMRLCSID